MGRGFKLFLCKTLRGAFLESIDFKGPARQKFSIPRSEPFFRECFVSTCRRVCSKRWRLLSKQISKIQTGWYFIWVIWKALEFGPLSSLSKGTKGNLCKRKIPSWWFIYSYVWHTVSCFEPVCKKNLLNTKKVRIYGCRNVFWKTLHFRKMYALYVDTVPITCTLINQGRE